MPMNPRLLRPTSTSGHPEANAWRTAVVSNGGSVSATTFQAVSTFCAAIDAAGIRDRFYRLNLFAGTGLNAALVPLYRGPTYGGTTYGNATDTNNGPFVSADYVETGASGGFSPGASNSTKYLDTGLGVDSIGITGHMSFYTNEDTTNTGSRAYLRMADTNRVFGMDDFGGVRCFYGELTNASAGNASLQGHFLVNRTAANSLAAYRNAVLNAVSNTNTTVTLPTRPMYVMASNDEGTAARHLRTRMCGYSMGLSFETGDDITSFYDAIETLNATLGRNA